MGCACPPLNNKTLESCEHALSSVISMHRVPRACRVNVQHTLGSAVITPSGDPLTGPGLGLCLVFPEAPVHPSSGPILSFRKRVSVAADPQPVAPAGKGVGSFPRQVGREGVMGKC